MLKVYAHPASQPSRAVIWACAIHNLPFDLIPDPTASNVNPRLQIPAIDDDGFILAEMPAILTYLADKHAWTDVYPRNAQTQARIAEYLHAHHSLTRLATMKMMAPHVLRAFGEVPTANPLSYISNTLIHAAMTDPQVLAEGPPLIHQVLTFIENRYLSDQPFVAGTAQPSIADIACYEEISQLQWANLLDLSEHRAISQWLEHMRALPLHDEAHQFNLSLGDIYTQASTMPRFTAAIENAMEALGALDMIHIA